MRLIAAQSFSRRSGWALGVAGEAQRKPSGVLDELRSRSVREYVSPICFALVHAGRGDRLMTVERLYEALEERSPFAIWTKVDPIFDSCRGDPGFEAVSAKPRVTDIE